RGARFGHPLAEAMPDLVADLAGQCEGASREPFALFGYSFGSYVAYALSLHLARRGRVPRRLFAGGSRAPFLPPRDRPRHLMADAELITAPRALNGTHPQVLASAELMARDLPIPRPDRMVAEPLGGATPP